MNYWLLKSEPQVYDIEDLKNLPQRTDSWEGIRNYQARNFIRDGMKVGDLGFFYHSSCKTPGIVGTVKVVKTAYPDFTAFDPKHRYFDPKSDIENPRWYMVDVQLKQIFSRIISLEELKTQKKLAAMTLLKRGNRLSIMPVTKLQWEAIMAII